MTTMLPHREEAATPGQRFRVRVKFICKDDTEHFIGLESRRGLPMELRWPEAQSSGVSPGGGRGPCTLPADAVERVDRELRERFEHWHRLGYVELHA
ncbi:hypothetical protein AA0Z99_10605 [Agrococcus sp. 1P02AA]|uniref:hypothetical protein n=1 Tax=Agrococcus sp. 1P02AA TaxID=3132259 RepID=UPI0039A71982